MRGQKALIPIADGNDDAEEEISTGRIWVRDGDLDFQSGRLVALRFQLPCPRGACIRGANLVLTAHSDSSTDAELVFQAEAADEPEPFNKHSRNISIRSLTNSKVVWEPGQWSKGKEYSCDDLKGLVQVQP